MFFLRDLVIKGVKIVASAFGQAYKNVAYGNVQGGPDTAKKAASAVDRMFRGKAMTLHEARQVLDVKEHDDPEKVNEAFERLYFSNAVQNNGSFYIQSKIYRAKQSMDIHFEMQKELEDEPGVASPKGPQ